MRRGAFQDVNKLGGSDSTIARAKKVFIHNKRGRVVGVTGNTAIHLQNTKNGGGKQPAWKDIYVSQGSIKFLVLFELRASLHQPLIVHSICFALISSLVLDSVNSTFSERYAYP